MPIQAGRGGGHAPARERERAGATGPLAEDFHVHSLFSDGTSTVAENVRMARRRGLRRICLVDHVHAGTDWVVRFALAVHAVRAVPGIEVVSGLEATLLDRTGRLDVPAGRLPGIDYVLIADHLFPRTSARSSRARCGPRSGAARSPRGRRSAAWPTP